MPYLLFNGVLSTSLPPDELDRRIAHALAPFAARTLPMFWMTGPSTQPDDLGQRLLAAGLSDAGELIGMAADLSALRADRPAPPDLVIERVCDRPTLKRWIGAFRAGFGYPAEVGRSFFAVFAGLGLEPVSARPLPRARGRGAGGHHIRVSRRWRRWDLQRHDAPRLAAAGVGAAMTLASATHPRVRGYPDWHPARRADGAEPVSSLGIPRVLHAASVSLVASAKWRMML